jgi:hypothetical protein
VAAAHHYALAIATYTGSYSKASDLETRLLATPIIGIAIFNCANFAICVRDLAKV